MDHTMNTMLGVLPPQGEGYLSSPKKKKSNPVDSEKYPPS